MSRPPNIVLTIADDQRGSSIGCEGVEAVRTPALDRLAEQGVRCRSAYHLGSCSMAVCAPSRAMLHSGQPFFQLPGRYMGEAWWRDDLTGFPPTLGERLQGLGYDCFATGKWHNTRELFARSFNAASNVLLGGMADHWFTPVHDFDPAGRYDAKPRIADGFSTDVFADSAVDFIRSRRRGDRPFFLYCAFTAPHDPRTPPDDYRRMYNPKSLDLPPNFAHLHPFDNGALNVRDERMLGHPRLETREPSDLSEVRREIADYYGMITHMDAGIGRVHEALAAAGIGDDTLVIHTADHGLAVGQHGLMGKQNVYEPSARVPLIAAGPGVARGHVASGLCYQHDLYPTLIEAAGGDAADSWFDSLGPLFGGDATAGRPFVGCAFRQVQRMVRVGDRKLIRYRVDGFEHEQVFDLAADPFETRDQSDDGVPRELIDALRDWQAGVGDDDVNFGRD
jgi:arylsulfatase A-like enzyme